MSRTSGTAQQAAYSWHACAPAFRRFGCEETLLGSGRGLFPLAGFLSAAMLMTPSCHGHDALFAEPEHAACTQQCNTHCNLSRFVAFNELMRPANASAASSSPSLSPAASTIAAASDAVHADAWAVATALQSRSDC